VKTFFKDSSLCRELNILPPALIRMKELLMENGYEFSEDVMDLKALAKEVARQVKTHG
jgi:energy-coupling factor transport system ATP-binding protein